MGIQGSGPCIGCWIFRRRTDQAESTGIIDRAKGASIDFPDTNAIPDTQEALASRLDGILGTQHTAEIDRG